MSHKVEKSAPLTMGAPMMTWWDRSGNGEQLGRFEGTLEDGTTQVHDIQTGSRIA